MNESNCVCVSLYVYVIRIYYNRKSTNITVGACVCTTVCAGLPGDESVHPRSGMAREAADLQCRL